VSRAARPPLLVVIGPTGSGKSELAHAVALRAGGEIVSADAFAVYRGFDVGTDKPDGAHRGDVRYHMVDVASPGEPFSAGRWAREARTAIEGIARRRRLPIVCGGTGFYVSALLESLPPSDPLEPVLRPVLARWAWAHPETARRLLEVNDPVSAAKIPPRNRRYLLRALEILIATGQRASQRARGRDRWSHDWRVLRVGILRNREDLYARIAARVRRMLENGWREEVGRLLEAGVSLESNAFRAIGYRDVAGWLQGRTSREETERTIVTATRQLAKRQKTWLGREPGITWFRETDALAGTLALLAEADAQRGTDGS
jgi:tRNA dimethylallyltransferase